MKPKKNILIFVDWFVPGVNAGGPIRSVYSMVKLLQNEFNFKIFTRNTDHNSKVEYTGIKPNVWTSFDAGIEVFYCSSQNLTKNTLNEIIQNTPFDYIYLNSVYSTWFGIYPMQMLKKMKQQHKVVLAPRGMLGKGALNIKPLKKKIFLTYAKLTGLYKHITWQASTDAEAKDIVRVFGSNVNIKIAGNLAYIHQLPFVEKEKSADTLKLFFLSRIVPIKNLWVALKALQKLETSAQIEFDIYGPIEDTGYWKACNECIQTMAPNKKVVYKGLLEQEQIQEQLKKYHALYMPTLNENFGHSILESFAAGCLVIISDQTPWNNLKELNIGFNVQVNQNNVEEQLQTAVLALVGQDQATFNTQALKAWSFAHFYLMNNKNIQDNKTLFHA